MSFKYYFTIQDSLYLIYNEEVIEDCLKSVGGSELFEIEQELYEHQIRLIEKGHANVRSPGFRLYLKVNEGVIEQYASAIHDVVNCTIHQEENCTTDHSEVWMKEWERRTKNISVHESSGKVRVLKKYSANMPEDDDSKQKKSGITCSIM